MPVFQRVRKKPTCYEQEWREFPVHDEPERERMRRHSADQSHRNADLKPSKTKGSGRPGRILTPEIAHPELAAEVLRVYRECAS